MSNTGSNPMIVHTSQGDVVIDAVSMIGRLGNVKTVKNVMIRISGGADSSMLAYMLAIYKRDYNPSINLYPMTCNNAMKPYQGKFAKSALDKITELTGVSFMDHLVADIPGNNYTAEQSEATHAFYKQYSIDSHYMGETMNPPLEVDKTFVYNGGGRDVTRDGLGSLTTSITGHKPFRNLDKKGICELYTKYGLLETLFPLTRSCEIQIDNKTFTDFDKHCGECWFCAERFWGFGRYE